MDEEKILDEKRWTEEANAVIKDIEKYVREIKISENLKSSNSKIYLNMTTVEKSQYCIELSSKGFTIVGYEYDCINQPLERYFETPYSLLDFISPKYPTLFGNDLMDKLKELSNENELSKDEEEEEETNL